VDHLLSLQVLFDLLLQGLIVDRLDPGNSQSPFIGSCVPFQDKARYQDVSAATHSTASGIKGGMSHQVQQLSVLEGQSDFLDEDIVTTDGHHLLIQWLVDVLFAQSPPSP
jgi:hypothetical protein